MKDIILVHVTAPCPVHEKPNYGSTQIPNRITIHDSSFTHSVNYTSIGLHENAR